LFLFYETTPGAASTVFFPISVHITGDVADVRVVELFVESNSTEQRAQVEACSVAAQQINDDDDDANSSHDARIACRTMPQDAGEKSKRG